MIPDLVTQRALDRYHQGGAASLTDEERILATIWYFESKVANSGFETFYKSSAGELAPFAPSAFRSIGAESLAEIAERANAAFAPGGMPKEAERRAAIAHALPETVRQSLTELEQRYEKVGDDLDALIEAYLARRVEAPASPRR